MNLVTARYLDYFILVELGSFEFMFKFIPFVINSSDMY